MKTNLLRSTASALAAFVLFLITATSGFNMANAQTIQVQAGNVQACGGDTVSVPIQILNANNLGAISLSLNYNGGTLSYVGFSNAHPSLGSNLIVNATTQGTQPQVRVAWFNLVPVSVNGLLLNMRFRATGNSTLSWDLQNAGNCELADSAANVLNNVTFRRFGIPCGRSDQRGHLPMATPKRQCLDQPKQRFRSCWRHIGYFAIDGNNLRFG